MYTSLLMPLLLISTAVAAKLPLSPDHFPIGTSDYDSDFVCPPRKRDLSVSDTAYGIHTLGQKYLLAPNTASDTLSHSSVFTPTTSELVSATTLVTVTASTPVSTPAAPTSTVPAVPDDTLAGVYVCDDINWNGACSHKFTKPGGSDIDCAQLSGQESSLGPDPGFLCEFFTF
ncbi:hypothetical protein G6011_07234 [Alternaria panax]|uniref:Uncharacterized protein n=1 Tax=Alternaria panax TaxID=48097 RepID=A0AAD4F9M6_9PLEO|nr:hypothetical protein G6011_07234 [Alternaria panax]